MHFVEGTEIKIISTVSITLASHLSIIPIYWCFCPTSDPSHRNSVFLPRYFLSEEVLFGVYLIDSVAAFLSS